MKINLGKERLTKLKIFVTKETRITKMVSGNEKTYITKMHRMNPKNPLTYIYLSYGIIGHCVQSLRFFVKTTFRNTKDLFKWSDNWI